MKTIVITGGLGQFGSHAIDLYLEKGYRVIGLHRRCSLLNCDNVKHNLNNPNFILYEGDITDSSSISDCIKKYQPDLWLNTAAQSHVGTSYSQPILTAEVNYLGVAKTLECIRLLKPDIRFWQASTSERFGNGSISQDTETPPDPVSPYAVSKVGSELLVNCYKNTYGMYCCYSIMFNYEGPRRAKSFVTRKISDFIGKAFNIVQDNFDKFVPVNKILSTQLGFEKAIEAGLIDHLYLGNIDSKRSWTHCKDIVRGVYDQMNLEKPTNLMFALKETHSVREFLDEAFACVGIYDWSNIVKIDKNLFRPSDVKSLHPTNINSEEIIGWKPQYTFKELVKEMVDNDIEINS